MDDRLTQHLRTWLGSWPPRATLDVIGVAQREKPGWDGSVRPVLGISDGRKTVLAVPTKTATAVRALQGDLDDPAFGAALAETVGRPGQILGRGIFRWTERPAMLAPLGTWVAPRDPRVPPWLQPFNGPVLIAFDEATGAYLAGLGRKQHDRHGHELSVGTDAEARGRGLARRLVATGARRVISDRAIPTYLHDPDNAASAKVADAAGFPDRGWTVLSLFADDARGQAEG